MAVHCLEKTIRSFSGAHCFRALDIGEVEHPVHRHDWPILSIYVMGRQLKIHEGGREVIDGPAAVLHAAGALHANHVEKQGLEQLDIEFDPAWLALYGVDLSGPPVRCWIGGPVGAASRVLAVEWRSLRRSEEELIVLTRKFLQFAMGASSPKKPPWLALAVRSALDRRGPVNTRQLALQIGLHPAWLAQAYRAAVGEGIQETALRSRTENAVHMLRTSEATCAEIAVAAGFCDQSHMIRACTRLLGRTPLRIREERNSVLS